MMDNKSNTNQSGIPMWIWAALAGVVLIIAVAIFALTRTTAIGNNTDTIAKNSLPKEISVAQAFEKRDEGAFILDVREPEEWEAGHIPEANWIPLAQLESRLNEVPKDREVVVVCRSGNRSATGRDILLQAGYPQVASMAGGMNDWQSQGLPIVTGK